MTEPTDMQCSSRLILTALPGIPVVRAGDDLVALVLEGLARADLGLAPGDIVSITSKIVSRAEGRTVDLRTVEPSARAHEVAAVVGSDPRIVELVLRESEEISRMRPGALITRHLLGHVSANAGIDRSNLDASNDEEKVLLLPSAPDATAQRIREGLAAVTGVDVGVVITDSCGRPFRRGTVGMAIGLAGMPAVCDMRGREDLFGRKLKVTLTALGDQVAAAADLVSGQSNEGRPIVHIRGLSFAPADARARDLVRARAEDLYV